MTDPVNPYCSCDPCNCAPPCTCQLELTRRYEDSHWDERAGELIHARVQHWSPVPGASRRHSTHDSVADAVPIAHRPTGSSAVPESPGNINAALADMRAGTYDVTGGLAAAAHEHRSVSVRTADHEGHTISIETTYRILIDGEEFADPIHVQDDGSVHYHGLPNYSTASAVDLMKLVVDNMTTEALPPLIGTPPNASDHADHGDHGNNGHHGRSV